jgi:hypothetical protein
MAPKNQDLSSREWLDRIGLSDEAPLDLLEDEPLDFDLRRFQPWTQEHCA